MVRSDLCDYSDVYIVVKGRIMVEGTNANNREDEKLTFKRIMLHLDHAYQNSITFIVSAEDLDIVMPMYNLLECSDNYSVILGF